MAGQPKLGVRGDGQPGPAVGGLGCAGLRAGPPEGLFEQPEGVLDVEAAQVGLPPTVYIGRYCAGSRAPQPDRFGVAVTGQVINLEADQRALDDGQRAVVVEPAGAVGQPGMQPIPTGGDRRAVAGGVRAGGVLR